jgi:hypothetical protein
MFILGHAGLTVAAARKVAPRLGWRLPAFLALLPDLIDKPVALFWPVFVHDNTKGVGHSAAAALAVLLVLLALRKKVGRPWLLWACFAGHLLLDRMWLLNNADVFWWPLNGPIPPALPESHSPRYMLYNLVGEAAGFWAVLRLRASKAS